MRSDSPHPSTTAPDLQPVGLVVRTLARWTWFIVPATVAVFLIGLGISEGDPEPAAADARLGLTNEVVWPFYDAARDRVELLVNSEEFEGRIEELIGAELLAIEVESPVNQAYLEVVVRAETLDLALAARDAVIEEITTASLDSQRVKLDQQRADLVDDLAASDALVADLELQIDEAVARQVEIGLQLVDNPSDAELRTEDRLLDSVRSRLITQRDGHLRTSETLERDLAEIDRILSALQPEVETLRISESAAEADSGVGPALAAAALALVATSIAVVMWDRERGRIRDPWYLEGPAGLPVLGSLRAGDPTGQAAAVDRLLTVVGPEARRIGFVAAGEVPAAAVIEDLVPVMADAISGQPDGNPAGRTGADQTVFVDLDAEYVDADRVRPLTRDCDAIVVICGAEQHIHVVRAASRAVADAGGRLVGAILAAPES